MVCCRLSVIYQSKRRYQPQLCTEQRKEFAAIKDWELPSECRNERLYQYFTKTILGPETLTNHGFDPKIHFRKSSYLHY